MMRAAAYCRVSTDKSDQIHSFNSQKAYFSQYIESRQDWILTEIYADEGITGTMTVNRAGFLKMIDDASQGKFNIIITKEVSRFSRNILDAISFTRFLKEKGVGVVFLNDGISTLDPDAELRLGIMASVAQEESRKTSERVRWGQLRKMEQGVVFGRSLLGYDVREGRISVELAGADTVRRIFRLFLNDRLGVRAIAKVLTESSTTTQSGAVNWSGASVLKILRNEKYCGDLLQKKTVTSDYLTHKKIKNSRDNAIYIPDHHEAIVSREEWEEAQAELSRRSPASKKNESCANRYALSGKMVCAGCRSTFLCRTRKHKDGSTYRVWNALSCTCTKKHRQFREESIAQSLRYITAASCSSEFTNGLNDIIVRIMNDSNDGRKEQENEKTLLDRKITKLIDIFLAGDVSREEYNALKVQYANDRARLESLRLYKKKSEGDDRIEEIMRMIHSLAAGEDSDDDFYLALVEHIEMKSDSIMDIYLKNMHGKWTVEF